MASVQELRPPSSRTPLRKRIGWHIAQGYVHAALFTISPTDAEELLVRNAGEDWHNRPVSRDLVAKYAGEMGRRNWRVTGEGLIITKTGKLRNGQHRLLACMRARVAFETMITFGVEDDTFAFMDRGKVRTAGNIFAINGEANANRMAASVLWVWRYHRGQMTSGTHRSLNYDELYAYLLAEHTGLRESKVIAAAFSAKNGKLAAPSLMMALHYLCAQKDAETADGFFKSVATGSGAFMKSARTPAYILRDKLLQSRLAGTPLTEPVTAALTIKAWNAVRNRERLSSKTFEWRVADEPFPTIV